MTHHTKQISIKQSDSIGGIRYRNDWNTLQSHPLSQSSLNTDKTFHPKNSESFDISYQLVNEALPIIRLTIQGGMNIKTIPLNELISRLQSEMFIFKNKILEIKELRPILLDAEYLLCAFIDNHLKTITFNNKIVRDEFSLLKLFHHPTDQAFFFSILHQSLDNCSLSSHLLPLCYLLIRLGYKDKTVNSAYGKKTLNQYLKKMYQTIRHQEGPINKYLFIQARNPKTHKKKNFWRSFTIIFAICGFMVMGYNQWQLNASLKPLYASLKHVINLPSSNNKFKSER